MKLIWYLASFGLAALLSTWIVPVMIRAAVRWGVVDRPDARLKQQREPVPYLGGISIYLSFLLTMALVFDFRPDVVAIFFGSTLVLLLGLVDDFGVLTPLQKLLGQLLATFVLVKSGVSIDIALLPAWANIGLTFLWMVGIMNAINLVDIMDGLAGTVSFIALLAFFAIAVVNGNDLEAMLAIALAGSLTGFLRHNRAPARVYMGDAGSLFLGLMLGAIAMNSRYSDTNPLGYLSPVMILWLPLFDTLFVMLVRAHKGRPVFLGSPDHCALRLKNQRKWPIHRIVAAAAMAGVIGGAAGVANIFLPAGRSLLLAGLGALVTIALGGLFWRIDPERHNTSGDQNGH